VSVYPLLLFNENCSSPDLKEEAYPEDIMWTNQRGIGMDCTSLYFLVHNGTVKIGRTEKPERRLDTMKVYLSHAAIMYVFDGKGHMEKNMHRCFADFKLSGEWFKYNARIKRFLKKFHFGKSIILEKY